jgi:hypothetical protein
MDDNQKKYLDKVVSLLVRDTEINYDKKNIFYPFIPFSKHGIKYFPFQFLTKSTSSALFLSFIQYSKGTYGLDSIIEREYVWDKYITTIKEKIK